MGIMLWVMQDLYHQPYGGLNTFSQPCIPHADPQTEGRWETAEVREFSEPKMP